VYMNTMERWVSIDKAKKVLGYKPTVEWRQGARMAGAVSCFVLFQPLVRRALADRVHSTQWYAKYQEELKTATADKKSS
jgi:hypothetical protein